MIPISAAICFCAVCALVALQMWLRASAASREHAIRLSGLEARITALEERPVPPELARRVERLELRNTLGSG